MKNAESLTEELQRDVYKRQGYNYCGIVGLFVVVIPFLTVGHKKNSDFIKEHPEYKGE